MKYPLSINPGNKKLPDYFQEIIRFHFPKNENMRILDPTCGEKYLWSDFGQSRLNLDLSSEKMFEDYEIVFSDIRDLGQEIVCDVKNLRENVEGLFDGIIYDPPYLFGVESVNDERDESYGGKYDQTYDELIWFMEIGNQVFPSLLNSEGKLIVKCQDQFHPKKRRFYPHHITWINKLEDFNLIDLFIHKYTRVSPTAYQVKDRPCSIIAHTYFLVFEKGFQE